ncbi:DNA-directed RNA polymerase subunit delta [Lentilactobacillus sp. SPB1-3]|uniref:DNA-directed RNA polymerase subunit delta n=1 Tax=Lentilactobacillus terminaliae TaxID=3003483 RepID=A0ACD5DGU7_9LACO|nr:DNA-directed RNA polymerase subunit delta [Lentilactobacillus sp. SPB1-3]MCZ0977929.1 DNA-directed RNA polymerase subunit delta [Lentilactobacillus sp. SPB1-3]
MELKVFEGQNKNELSMIEVAHAILAERGDVMPFADLANAVQEYLGDSNKEIRDRLSQFYTDLNIDGSFISLGDNLWGLRTWYPYESIDEATVHTELDDEDRPKKKKRRKVNAFLADASDDDDVIDYDDDDPEDQDDDFDDESDDEDETTPDTNIGKYDNDLADIDDDSDDDDSDDSELPDGIEGELTDLSDDDDDLLASDDDDDDDTDGDDSSYEDKEK